MTRTDTACDSTGRTGSPPDPPGASVRRPPGPSVRPALIVVGLALLIVLVFAVGAALTHNATPKAPKPALLRGTGLVAEPAAATLHPIRILTTPPADILDALVLPQGARTVSATPWKGSTQYSGSMSFRLGATQATLVRFFHAELHAHGWSITDVGPAHDAPGATEVLGQHASTDGWFWETGVVVFPTSFGRSGTQTTRFRLELYEVPDAT
ncbi:MAG: hypothetical protein ACRDXC_11810 [Acidimicrobiales bacterium]